MAEPKLERIGRWVRTHSGDVENEESWVDMTRVVSAWTDEGRVLAAIDGDIESWILDKDWTIPTLLRALEAARAEWEAEEAKRRGVVYLAGRDCGPNPQDSAREMAVRRTVSDPPSAYEPQKLPRSGA